MLWPLEATNWLLALVPTTGLLAGTEAPLTEVAFALAMLQSASQLVALFVSTETRQLTPEAIDRVAPAAAALACIVQVVGVIVSV